ncbi:MAG: hypothetical protein A2Z73_00905 [Deltaproteobacteria bacterium RBG_13_60_28]|nr:MAG: hypothetical protein A2Z73_00905 [Deltaproteobacteria bacterium RBG_13_60_28]
MQAYAIGSLKKIEDTVYRGPGLSFRVFIHPVIHDQVNPASIYGRGEAEVKEEKASSQGRNQEFSLHGNPSLVVVYLDNLYVYRNFPWET